MLAHTNVNSAARKGAGLHMGGRSQLRPGKFAKWPGTIKRQSHGRCTTDDGSRSLVQGSKTVFES